MHACMHACEAAGGWATAWRRGGALPAPFKATHLATSTHLAQPPQGAAIGDVFVSTGKMHHDRRIPLPGFDKQGLGYVDSTPTPALRQALGLKAGIVTSGAHARA